MVSFSVSIAPAFVAAAGVLLGWVVRLDEAVVATRVDALPERRGTGLRRVEERLLAAMVRPRGIARLADRIVQMIAVGGRP